MKMLSALNATANRLIGHAVVLLFAAMTTIILMQVFFRYVLENSLSWSEELARYMFIWLTFLGASIAMREKAHIKVSEIVGLVKNKKLNAILRLAACVAGIVFLYILTTNSLVVAQRVFSLGQVSPTMEFLPIGVTYFAIPIGCLFMILNLVEQAYPICLDIIRQS
ncbi:TRAP transporter small permease [Oleispirillum naphthae]|uniref:TRAP transporter small permease n=1 Tax=Oleispirillum naphthae TaxID=2838853 RepID=UPI0030824521